MLAGHVVHLLLAGQQGSFLLGAAGFQLGQLGFQGGVLALVGIQGALRLTLLVAQRVQLRPQLVQRVAHPRPLRLVVGVLGLKGVDGGDVGGVALTGVLLRRPQLRQLSLQRRQPVTVQLAGRHQTLQIAPLGVDNVLDLVRFAACLVCVSCEAAHAVLLALICLPGCLGPRPLRIQVQRRDTCLDFLNGALGLVDVALRLVIFLVGLAVGAGARLHDLGLPPSLLCRRLGFGPVVVAAQQALAVPEALHAPRYFCAHG
mmetsp:Transcript_12260/g.36846  ORF Transcript_12260/g.36846 Transcript_12260/m.36846 type:complete len:259 (-) Transcript_12260:790-1566(-)